MSRCDEREPQDRVYGASERGEFVAKRIGERERERGKQRLRAAQEKWVGSRNA